jgi:hypothetical protein
LRGDSSACLGQISQIDPSYFATYEIDLPFKSAAAPFFASSTVANIAAGGGKSTDLAGNSFVFKELVLTRCRSGQL